MADVANCQGIPFGSPLTFNVPEGKSVKYGASQAAIYRYTNNQLRQYPNPDIFLSWEPSESVEVINCFGLPAGPPMAHYKPPTSVKCDASEAAIYRRTDGELCQYQILILYFCPGSQTAC